MIENDILRFVVLLLSSVLLFAGTWLILDGIFSVVYRPESKYPCSDYGDWSLNSLPVRCYDFYNIKK